MDDGDRDLTTYPRVARPRDVLAGGPQQILAVAFGIPTPTGEQALWDAMSETQRVAAIRRLTALLRSERRRDAPTAEAGAAEAGISLNRWYEMSSAWRERRSLASVGIAADAPRTRTMSHHDALQRLVVPVVDGAAGASVRQMSFALADEWVRKYGAEGPKLPSENTLRKFVQAELRRRAREETPGNEVMFDCCGCGLPHAEGIFTAFLILDKASRAILGAALGDAGGSRAGYASAARDALDRLKRPPLQGLDWAEKLERSELVYGLDEHAWVNHAAEMRAMGMRNQLQPVTRAKRFGAYVRPLIGARMGRIRFLPGKISKEEATARATADDERRFAVEVDIHNVERAAEREALEPGRGQDLPPADLINLLKRAAKG